MKLQCVLPHALLVLLLSPLLCDGTPSNSNATSANDTSPYDPFQQLRSQIDIKPREPVCCLIPLTTDPLPTTAEFLSFEEWKSKQRELQAQAQAANHTPSPDTSVIDGGTATASSGIAGDPELTPPTILDHVPSPHFRVPLTDRFNYASLDCSARVHTSHRSGRFPEAILSSKKDKYMLSPCSADPNFVVVELCDDIRIDTVQLANFEFFSGVFRDFKVSVAQTYTPNGQGWIEAGTYRAKNIRSVQSFHPVAELRPFYRYIRIDFLSHYGNEFYCPVSLLRVYGLTQMEEWKWEVWQSGSENNGVQKRQDLERVEETYNSSPVEDMNGTMVTTVENRAEDTATQETSLNVVHHQTTPPKVNDTVLIPVSHSFQTAADEIAATTPKSTGLVLSSSLHAIPQALVIETHTSVTSIATLTTSGNINVNSTKSNSAPLGFTSIDATASSNMSDGTSSSSSSSIQLVPSTILASPNPSGESIYRTIMNRLTMIETNTTLYQKYVEEQTLQIRESLRRLEEEVGRLEGISKSQQNVFSKTMRELEMKRQQMDEERWELLTRVNHLAKEVTLEKRLGIAQLCLLLTVLVFMALTRGSRAIILDGTTDKLNGFNHGRTWASTDWSKKGWLSRSRSITPMNHGKEHKYEGREVIIMPHKETSSSIPFPTTPPARYRSSRSAVHHPTTPRRQDISRITDESRPVGRLRRSNSHTTPSNVVVSAKRFARTAHLHEVQPNPRNREVADDDGATRSANENIATLYDGSPKPRRRVDELSGIPALSVPGTSRGEESGAGCWVDTEAGSDSASTSYDADLEVRDAVQEVQRNLEFDSTAPTINAVPFKRRKPLGSLVPASLASTSTLS